MGRLMLLLISACLHLNLKLTELQQLKTFIMELYTQRIAMAIQGSQCTILYLELMQKNLISFLTVLCMRMT